MGNRRGADRVLVGRSRVTDRLEDPSVDGTIILKWGFKELDVGLYWIHLR
jgi:hypothetical protein